jgi:hypothetical protein
LARVEGLMTDILVGLPPKCYALEKDIITVKQKQFSPFQVEPINLSLRASKTGIFMINPRVVFIDDLGQTKTFQVDPVSITVKPAATQPRLESVSENMPYELEFISEAERKAFNYLINAFVDDYKRMRKPLEQSGWRTLMEIVRRSGITKHSVYGFSGKRGHAIAALEHARLVEARVFSGERGRGGKILKLRIAYENETVRNQI